MRVVSYHSDEGCRTAIISEGRKWVHFLSIDSPMHMEKVKKDELRFMRDTEYDLRETARMYRRSGKHLGITDGAKKFLLEIIRGEGESNDEENEG